MCKTLVMCSKQSLRKYQNCFISNNCIWPAIFSIVSEIICNHCQSKQNESKSESFNSKSGDYIIQLARECIKICQGELDKDAEAKLSLRSQPGSSISVDERLIKQWVEGCHDRSHDRI